VYLCTASVIACVHGRLACFEHFLRVVFGWIQVRVVHAVCGGLCFVLPFDRILTSTCSHGGCHPARVFVVGVLRPCIWLLSTVWANIAYADARFSLQRPGSCSVYVGWCVYVSLQIASYAASPADLVVRESGGGIQVIVWFDPLCFTA
jgi:hypothetical protein